MSSPAAHHRFQADLRRGPLHLYAAFDLTSPWTVLFGPSGSGKSTILRAICGLFPKSSVIFEGRPSGTESASHALHQATPSPPRRLAYAPQGAVLFPHLTVRKNVSFSTDCTPQSSPDLIQQILTLFELTSLADRLPRDLSGGERQRVNLARAFAVREPTLFLLDEPFSGVDRAMRDALLPRMRHHIAQLSVPVISVTHDVEEAFLLDAEVIRIEHGKVIDQGPATQVLHEERSRMLQILQP